MMRKSNLESWGKWPEKKVYSSPNRELMFLYFYYRLFFMFDLLDKWFPLHYCCHAVMTVELRLRDSLSLSISLLDLTQLFLQQDTLLYEVCDLCSLCSHVLSLVSQMILLQPHSPDFEWNGFISSEETNRESKTSKCVLWSLTRVWVHLSLACKNYTSVTVSRLSIDSLNELR